MAPVAIRASTRHCARFGMRRERVMWRSAMASFEPRVTQWEGATWWSRFSTFRGSLRLTARRRWPPPAVDQAHDENARARSGRQCSHEQGSEGSGKRSPMKRNSRARCNHRRHPSCPFPSWAACTTTIGVPHDQHLPHNDVMDGDGGRDSGTALTLCTFLPTDSTASAAATAMERTTVTCAHPRTSPFLLHSQTGAGPCGGRIPHDAVARISARTGERSCGRAGWGSSMAKLDRQPPRALPCRGRGLAHQP